MTLENALLIACGALASVCSVLFFALQKSWRFRIKEAESQAKKTRMILRDTTEAIKEQTNTVNEFSIMIQMLIRNLEK
tara:strand:- start:1024 stop:1257 length:234 start_codon:yes stop_codon:yes gene_type:complete